MEKARGEVEDRIESVDAALVTVDPSRTEDASERLLRNPAVDFVEPNYVLRASRIPNDRNFGDQWGLRNLGHFDGKAGADISATAAWDVTTATNAIVAVVDTGVAYQHPDLAGNAWRNPADPANGLDDDGDGFGDNVFGADFYANDSNPDDDGGHGTHVAGIIGGQGNNAVGITGVSWDVNVMALKFLDENGEGNTADAANAIDFAVTNGARIVNASWGGPSFSQALYGSIRRAGERGTLVVAAAGNEGFNADTKPDYPAAFDLPNIVSVAATDRTDRLLDFSNYGAKSVDLAAPGDDITSTVPVLTDPSGYAAFSDIHGGTLRQRCRGPVPVEVPASERRPDQGRTSQSTDKLPTLAGKTVTGGRLNIARTLGERHRPRDRRRTRRPPRRSRSSAPATGSQRASGRWASSGSAPATRAASGCTAST